jgi:hypothetical protein
VPRACFAAALMFLAGCSGSDKWVDGRPPVYPVSGQVVYQGKPLEGASVTFSPLEGTHGGAGQTDVEGRFSLTTFEANDGVPAGKYRVTVTKAEAIVTPHPDDPGAVNLPPLKVEQRHLIPERYSSPETSDLTAEVSESGENDFSFELVEADK